MNDVRYGPEAAIATARAAGVPLITMSMTTNRQTLFRPPDCRFRNTMVQLAAVGMAFPSRIWGAVL